MEERLKRLESEVSEMKTIAVEAITETRHATGALNRLADKLEILITESAKGQARHIAQQDINKRVDTKLDEHGREIHSLSVALGVNSTKTDALWSQWLKIGGVSVVIVAGIAKASGVF